MSEGTATRPAATNAPRRRWLGKAALVCGAAAACLTVAFAAWVVSLGPLPLAEAQKVSTTVIDRNGDTHVIEH